MLSNKKIICPDNLINVAKVFMEVICDPIIALKKTVMVAFVNPKTWLIVNKLRFLFINELN